MKLSQYHRPPPWPCWRPSYMCGGGEGLSYILAPQRGTWGSNKPAKVWLKNVKCTMKCCFTPTTHAAGEEVEEPDPHPVGGGRTPQLLWGSPATPQKVQHGILPDDPAIPLLGSYPREIKPMSTQTLATNLHSSITHNSQVPISG